MSSKEAQFDPPWMIFVVLRVAAVAVVDACLKRFNICHHFLQLRLTQNTRENNNEQEFYGWFLQSGNGNLSPAPLSRFSQMPFIFLKHDFIMTLTYCKTF